MIDQTTGINYYQLGLVVYYLISDWFSLTHYKIELLIAEPNSALKNFWSYRGVFLE